MKTKPFNLEECLAGKPMVTRSGNNVRFVKMLSDSAENYPLLIEVDEYLFWYSKDGVYDIKKQPKGSSTDLLMVDESEDAIHTHGEYVGSINASNKDSVSSQHEAGVKLDQDKIPVRRGLLEQFPKACLAVAEVSAFGAEKYTWGGWQHVEDGINRYGDAGMRHALQDGVDEESGLLHAAHEAWNALARLELILRSK